MTGSNALPLVLFAAMCYAFGAVALKLASKRRRPAGSAAEDTDDEASR